MHKKLTIALALIILLGFSLMTQISAQTREAGVFEDNWFTYTIVCSWNSNDANAPVPGDLVEINNTLYYNCSILEVVSTNVTSTQTHYYMNGTEETVIVVQDVATGNSFLQIGLIEFIAANLHQNDLLYASTDDQRRINSTVNINYGSTTRETNAVHVEYPILDAENNTIGGGTQSFYYDKKTGALVAVAENSVTAAENISIALLIDSTNRWLITSIPSMTSPSPTPSSTGTMQIFGMNLSDFIIITVIIVVIVVIAVTLFLRGKQKKRRKRRHR